MGAAFDFRKLHSPLHNGILFPTQELAALPAYSREAVNGNDHLFVRIFIKRPCDRIPLPQITDVQAKTHNHSLGHWSKTRITDHTAF